MTITNDARFTYADVMLYRDLSLNLLPKFRDFLRLDGSFEYVVREILKISQEGFKSESLDDASVYLERIGRLCEVLVSSMGANRDDFINRLLAFECKHTPALNLVVKGGDSYE